MSLFSVIDDNGNAFDFPQKAYEEAVLQVIEENVKGDDYKIVCSAGSNKGDNFLGVVYRFDVKDKKDESLKLSLILKSAPQCKERREDFQTRLLFERESLFYDEVFPLYKKFQEEKGIDVEKDGLNNFPHCYKVLHEENCEGLIFENIRLKGFEMFNRHDDLTKDYVMATMKSLGKFHALFYALKDQKPELIKKFQEIDDVFLKFGVGEGTSTRIGVEAQIKTTIKLVERSNNENIKKRVLDFLKGDVIKEFHEVPRGDLAEPYATLCHGDCMNANIMFLTNEGVPSDVKFLDLQLMRYASPACDLSYYLFISTTKDLRDKHYREFLDAYYESLSSFMARLGSSPHIIFPREALDDQMKRFGRFGVLMGIILIPLFMHDSDDAPDFDLIAKTYKESLEDPSKDIYVVSYSDFNSEETRAKYEEKMMNVFEDLCNFDYI